MVFSSPIFLFVFLPLVLAVYHASPWPLRNVVLLVASLVFYAWGETVFVAGMLASIAMNWAFGLWVGRAEGRRRRRAVAVAVAANLLLLGWFKYADFVVANLRAIRPGTWPNWGGVHLPIGISFFTFQALSYVLDVARGGAAPERNPLRLGLFISLFPQLIAGPIVRYLDIAHDLVARRETWERFVAGVQRFTVGLGKKILIANVLAGPADQVFSLAAGELSAPVAWLGLAAYMGQIYFDFSGYSDMAVGLGRMFGFELPENFRHPYAAASVTEFWRRWHITLSTWFRDYLYIPLGGNRRGPVRTAVNLLTVFVLCGLWHGAAWNFVVWGLYHGALLALERPWREIRRPAAARALGHAWMLVAVAAGWVIFRADSLSHAGRFFAALAGGNGGAATVAALATPIVWLALAAAALGSFPWWRTLADRLAHRPAGRSLQLAAAWARVPAHAAVWLLCWMRLAAATHNPFIYFRF